MSENRDENSISSTGLSKSNALLDFLGCSYRATVRLIKPKDQCKYSFYGYIRCDDNGSIFLIRNGGMEQFPSSVPDASQLPPVRYILPYPNLAIQRSAGAYKNYYGY